jgi:hypothetical protein
MGLLEHSGARRGWAMLRDFERTALIWGSDYESTLKIVLLALNSFIDAEGRCWPGLERLTEMCGMSRSTLKRKLSILRDDGVIDIDDRFHSSGRRTSNLYRVNFEKLESMRLNLTPKESSPSGDLNRGYGSSVNRGYGSSVNHEQINKELIQKEEFLNIGDSDFFEAQFDPTQEENEPPIVEGELIEPSDNLQQNRSTDPENRIVEIKSSGAAAVFSGAGGAFLAAYNEDKPPLWSQVLKPTPPRERAIKALLREYDNQSDALQAFRDALAYCRQDAWWGTKSLGIDNLFRNGRVTELAEKWRTIAENPQQRATIEALANPQEAYEWAKAEAAIAAIAARGREDARC